MFIGLHVQNVYTHLGISSIHILLLSAPACMHFVWKLQLDLYVYTKCNQNAYMHEELTKEFGVRIVAGST